MVAATDIGVVPVIPSRRVARVVRPTRPAPKLDPTAVFVQGMHGLGDNIMQRAVIRQLLEKRREVWLETPWPFLYHDLVDSPSKLRLVNKGSRLRTQAKNARRERHAFHGERAPAYCTPLQVSYQVPMIRQCRGDVLRAMLTKCGCNANQIDFRIPVKAEWRERANAILADYMRHDARPLMILRPLTERAEWQGNHTRNPLPGDYHTLVSTLRPFFHIISVADLEPGAEWLVDPASFKALDVDQTLHAGELTPEVLLAVIEQAALVFTAPGFATVMAQAVGTPNVTVFGGYQSSLSLRSLAKVGPSFFIDPVKPCDCYSHSHACAKQIDTAYWIPTLQEIGQMARGLQW